MKELMKSNIYDVEATIFVLRKSHKGIVIGKDGAMLKRIGMYARQDMERTLDTKINLKSNFTIFRRHSEPVLPA